MFGLQDELLAAWRADRPTGADRARAGTRLDASTPRTGRGRPRHDRVGA